MLWIQTGLLVETERTFSINYNRRILLKNLLDQTNWGYMGGGGSQDIAALRNRIFRSQHFPEKHDSSS